MKTRKLVYPILLVLIVFSFSYCKKYEEGPTISVVPKNQRVANAWTLEAKFKNGTEQQVSDVERKSTLTLTADGKAEGKYTDGSFSYSGDGTWEFSEDKEEITIIITYSGFGMSGTDNKTYKILKLKSNELWLEYIDGDGDKIEYHYEPA